MRPFRFIAIVICLTLFGCNSPSEKQQEAATILVDTFDLEDIKARGSIVALTDFSSTSYFIYRGVPMGFEYDLLQRFADHIGVELKMHVVEEMDSIGQLLKAKDGDIIAANFTITSERMSEVAFTEPVLQTRQVLVQRLPENWHRMRKEAIDKALVRDPMELIGDTVQVRRGSSFFNRLHNLMEELGDSIYIQEAGNRGTEELIEKVALGEIKYTVADENIALLNKGYYPNIDINTPLSFNQRVAWATRPESAVLLDSLNSWLMTFQDTQEYAILYLKYFKARSQHKKRVLSEYSSLKGDKISPYDGMIKAESERLKWNWKLLTAMIFQESNFVADAEAWTGASGLMQLIPETAERFGADSVSDPQQNIHAGVSFLITLQKYWSKQELDSLEQIRFVLASYNVGLGHVLDAVRLTEKYEGNPTVWEDVSIYLEKKAQPEYYKDEVVRHGYCRGSEPVNYVREVLQNFEHYNNTEL